MDLKNQCCCRIVAFHVKVLYLKLFINKKMLIKDDDKGQNKYFGDEFHVWPTLRVFV